MMKQDKSKEVAKAAEKKTVSLNIFHPETYPFFGDIAQTYLWVNWGVARTWESSKPFLNCTNANPFL